MKNKESTKLPVVIAGTNCLSGVTSWADQLRTALAKHPRYEVRTLYVGPKAAASGDVITSSLDEAHEVIRDMAPLVLVPNYVWSLYLAGFEPGVRCLGMCHADSDDQYYRPLSWYEPAIAKYIAVSQECANRLTQYVPVRESDITMLPYGVCLPKPLKRDYHAKPLRLIYAGRVTQPQKRVWDFLPLVENLLRERVPFVFNIYGDGDEYAPLRQIMQSRVPAADVVFHGRVPHSAMRNIWLSHDIFLQVSDFEGTSVSMLEAMAHGVVPVVTAASSGIDGVITPENGFVVPVGDMPSMAAVIAQLAGDEASLAKVGRTAYRTAETYAMDLYAEKFAQVLDEVVATEDVVDYHERYGVFSPTHPLVMLRQQMELQGSAPVRRKKHALRQLLQDGLQVWRRPQSQPTSPGQRQAA